MNILQVITKLDAADRAEDVLKSTRFLTLNGHKAMVASRESELTGQIDEVGARHYRLALAFNPFLILADILRLSRIVLRENIQIIHARDELSSFVAFFAARIRKSVFISTVYEHKKRNIFWNAQFWAKRVICFSESETRHFAEGGAFMQNKVSLIPPFVDTGQGRPARGAAGQYFVIGAQLPLDSHKKLQNFMITASILARSVNKMKIFIVEDPRVPQKAGKEKVKLLIKRYSLGATVSFLPEEKEKGMMSTLDLFVQINQKGAVSVRRLLEAASLGIPIVTTDVDWLRDYAEDKKTAAICPPEAPREMAGRILELYKDAALSLEMTDNARNFVKEKFDIKKMMQALLYLYEEALACKNILIIKIAALGDVILASPSVRAIREKFPKAKIKLLTGIDKKEIFANSPAINEIIVCDLKGRDKGLKGLFRVARKLRSEDFDIVVDLQNNKKSHILSFLSCAPERYGYDNGKLSFLLNRKIKEVKFSMDPVLHQSKVLGLLGIHNIDKKLEIWISKDEEDWTNSFLESHWIKSDMKLVAINMGSSKRWVTKLWPPRYFADVANRLASEVGIRVVLIGLEKENLRIEEFQKYAKCKPINALGKTSIPKLASLLKRCSVLLSSDSAPLHVGLSVKIPVVAFFGPTDPARHLAPSGKCIVLRKDLKCAPCYSTHCYRSHKCMRSIKPDEAYEGALKLLNIKGKDKICEYCF